MHLAKHGMWKLVTALHYNCSH